MERRTPKIRFKGFTEKWEKKQLGEMADVYDGTHQTPNYTKNGVMFLSVENIKTLCSDKFISKEAFNQEFKIFPQKGDILMTRIGDIGTANIVENDEQKAYYVSLALIKPKGVYSYFMKECIHSISVKKELWKRTLHIAFPIKINKNEISKIDIDIGDFSEQTKIGDFFKNIDNLIAVNQRKYEKLLNIKKAFLEKMFPNGEADTPEIRFKGFTEKWERKQLKDLALINKGVQLSKIDMRVYGQYLVVNGGISPSGFTDKYNYTENHITISEGGESCGYINLIKSNFWAGGHCYILTNIKTDLLFLFQILKSYENMIKELRTGSGLPNINRTSIENFVLFLPKVFSEQTKIGDFFKNIDNLISLRFNQVEKLKKIKKALLEKMFI